MIDGRAFVESNLARYVEELTEFAGIPSHASDAGAIAEAARWLCAALARRGVDAQILPTLGKPVVVGKIGAGSNAVLLYNHYDVQPPGLEQAWTSPPFAPTQRDGKLYARGAIDDKGEIVARLAALDLLRARHGDDIPLVLTFFAEGEEESGSPNLEPFIREHRELLAADACIWEAGQVDDGGRPQVWLGVRGLLYVELIVTTMKHDAHSGWAHALPSAPWRLIEALATLRDARGNVQIDGFNDGLIGPSDAQRALLKAMPDEAPGYRAEYGIDRLAGDRSGYALREAVFAPTCNISGIWSGHTEDGMKTVTPAHAYARLDFRLAPGQDPQVCFNALRAHLDARGFNDVAVQPLDRGQRAACSDPEHPFVALAIEVLREHYAAEPLVSPLVGGTGPAAHVANHLGMPFASIGCSYPGGRKHAPDENIRLSDFIRGAAAIADILERYARYSKPSSMIASR